MKRAGVNLNTGEWGGHYRYYMTILILHLLLGFPFLDFCSNVERLTVLYLITLAMHSWIHSESATSMRYRHLEHRRDEDSVLAHPWEDPQSINIQAFQSFKGKHTMYTDNMHRNNQ